MSCEQHLRRLIFDATILSVGSRRVPERSGIFFVAQNLLLNLLKQSNAPEIVLYCHPWRTLALRRYLSEVPEFASRQLRIIGEGKASRFADRLRELVLNLREGNPFLGYRVMALWKFFAVLREDCGGFSAELDESLAVSDAWFSPMIRAPKKVRTSGIPVFYYVHDMIPMLNGAHGPADRFRWQMRLYSVLDADSLLFTNSNATARDLKHFLPAVRPERIITAYPAANGLFVPADRTAIAKVRVRIGLPEDVRYLLSVCTLEPRKNIVRSVRAFFAFCQAHPGSSVYFVLTGGDKSGFLRNLGPLIPEDFRNRLILTGYVPDEELGPLYSGAAALVYPSMYEGFGLPIVEAMQCGTPVITSNCSSLPEVADTAAILVNPESVEEITAAMEQIVLQPESAESLRAAAITRAKVFSWEICAGTVIAGMNRMLSERRERVALLHYWLVNFRGGERVLAEICGMYPETDIFTHAWNPSKLKEPFSLHRITETFIARMPFGRSHCQMYLPLMPTALKSLDLRGYDLIISSESGPAKGIRKPPRALHICYCHTPMRYLWDLSDEYFANASLPGKLGMLLFLRYLRNFDLKSAQSVDYFIANSRFVAERIRRIYGRSADVVYPPVNTAYFRQPAETSLPQDDYYLLAGQLVPYKRADIALDACLSLGRKLVIIGAGPMEKQLRKRAAGNSDILFAGQVGDDELRAYYQGAKALLFPGIEDFGIVPVEAQASGTPVIAFGEGGALETVLNGETGMFFREQTAESLSAAILEFEGKSWDADACRKHAELFSPDKFIAGMRAAIAAARSIRK